MGVKKLPGSSTQLSSHPQTSSLSSGSTQNHDAQPSLPTVCCPDSWHRICERNPTAVSYHFVLVNWNNHHHRHSWTCHYEFFIFWNPKWFCRTLGMLKNTIQAQCRIILCGVKPFCSTWSGLIPQTGCCPWEPRQLHKLTPREVSGAWGPPWAGSKMRKVECLLLYLVSYVYSLFLLLHKRVSILCFTIFLSKYN